MINKIQKAFGTAGRLLVFFLTACTQSISAQDTSYTRPPVTGELDQYQQQVKQQPEKEMLELKKLMPSIRYDLRYAQTSNIANRRMYPAGTATTFLRKPAALALQQVQQTLASKGYGLKIFDAYRPYSVTVKFWELIHDERFVAHPKNGSGHNRGAAVDLTIIRLDNGQELDMGTGFDNFSDTANHSFAKLPEPVLQNRQLLRTTMEKFGFRTYADEWWHYSWPEASKFEILDISFKKLAKAFIKH